VISIKSQPKQLHKPKYRLWAKTSGKPVAKDLAEKAENLQKKETSAL
jgi:hypothetical protein